LVRENAPDVASLVRIDDGALHVDNGVALGEDDGGVRFAEVLMKMWLMAGCAAMSLATAAAADPVALTVHTDQTTKTIDARIYGQFLEHIFNSVHGGLWGDQILNGTLELAPARAGAATGTAVLPATAPRYWTFVGSAGEVTNGASNPLNAGNSVRLTMGPGAHSGPMPGIQQSHIALKAGEDYTLTLYARGDAGVSLRISFADVAGDVMLKPVTGLKEQWQAFTLHFTPPRPLDDTSIYIALQDAGTCNIDQISLFSAAALASGGYRPDLLKAVSDLQPATIRWPGGSFANKYIWQNGIGAREKRLPHPAEQWNDRDPYQFGTDEFLQLCEKINSEGILVLNTARGVDDALHWLEYCMGDATTEYGKQRAANGHAAPYDLKTIEIDNEPWLLMQYPAYLDIVNKFCPAIRAQYPKLKLSVAGSYAYDTGPGEGNQAANRNWDPRIIEQAGRLFDILSPHYYNGLLTENPPDYKEDPRKYEEFLKGRGDMIRKSANPHMKIYVSEWNLTYGRWGNDWRVGLYAGGILNAFERQGDLVEMSCPALFMRKIGVTTSWDNALINFDQKAWFPAGNYVVMKLWREAFAPNLLAVEGPDHPLNFVAARSVDKKTVYLKVVNPESTAVEAAIRFDGDLAPKTAVMQLIAPGAEDVKNSLAEPNKIKAAPAAATIDGRTVKFTMPAWSAATVRITP
jgi:alpha-L-arabinofuranosidase